MSAHASRIFGQPTPENRGPSFALSIGVTAALFAFAFAAMRSLPDLSLGVRSRLEPPVEVQLPRVILPAPPTPITPTKRVASRERLSAPAAAPTTIAPPSSAVASPITAPSSIPSVPRDSNAAGGVARTAAADAALRASLRSGSTGLGAPAVPVWTKSAEKVANTPQTRDSILRAKMAQIPGLMKTHVPTGAEKAELEASQLAAKMLSVRRTTSGDSRDLVNLQGKGKDGVGAVSAPGMVSIPFPLFSPGPSPAQRKKNEALDADYQARLRRLQDSVFSKHDRRVADSLRVDSLRHDSLRRDSLARRKPS